MRSFTEPGSKIGILYPEDIMFCYNPEILTMTMEKDSSGEVQDFYMYVTIKLTGQSVSYNDLRASASGLASVDISSYTKLFFKKEELESVAEKSMTGKNMEIEVKYLFKEDYEKTVVL